MLCPLSLSPELPSLLLWRLSGGSTAARGVYGGATRMAALCRTLEQENGDPGPLVADLVATYPATLAEIRSAVSA